jgi:folate-dependent phosphoribosylglycinamide formyltransferase PurN
MNVLLLLGPALDWYFAEAISRLADLDEIVIVGALIEERPPGFRFKTLRRELEKGRGGYVLVMALNSMFRRMAGDAQSSAAFCKARGVPAWPVRDLYAPETIELMRDAAPDMIFRSGFGIIREPVLSLPPAGVLSYHHGDMRRYRGQPVGFWELYNGEAQMGVTLQILAEKLDAGTVVAERAVPIRPTDSWRQLERRAYQTGIDMLPEACLMLARDAASPQPIPAGDLGDLYTLPNFRQWAGLQRRVLARRVASPLSANGRGRPPETSA